MSSGCREGVEMRRAWDKLTVKREKQGIGWVARWRIWLLAKQKWLNLRPAGGEAG